MTNEVVEQLIAWCESARYTTNDAALQLRAAPARPDDPQCCREQHCCCCCSEVLRAFLDIVAEAGELFCVANGHCKAHPELCSYARDVLICSLCSLHVACCLGDCCDTASAKVQGSGAGAIDWKGLLAQVIAFLQSILSGLLGEENAEKNAQAVQACTAPQLCQVIIGRAEALFLLSYGAPLAGRSIPHHPHIHIEETIRSINANASIAAHAAAGLASCLC